MSPQAHRYSEKLDILKAYCTARCEGMDTAREPFLLRQGRAPLCDGTLMACLRVQRSENAEKIDLWAKLAREAGAVLEARADEDGGPGEERPD